jgi:hypothetical protein
LPSQGTFWNASLLKEKAFDFSIACLNLNQHEIFVPQPRDFRDKRESEGDRIVAATGGILLASQTVIIWTSSRVQRTAFPNGNTVI